MFASARAPGWVRGRERGGLLRGAGPPRRSGSGPRSRCRRAARRCSPTRGSPRPGRTRARPGAWRLRGPAARARSGCRPRSRRRARRPCAPCRRRRSRPASADRGPCGPPTSSPSASASRRATSGSGGPAAAAALALAEIRDGRGRARRRPPCAPSPAPAASRSIASRNAAALGQPVLAQPGRVRRDPGRSGRQRLRALVGRRAHGGDPRPGVVHVRGHGLPVRVGVRGEAGHGRPARPAGGLRARRLWPGRFARMSGACCSSARSSSNRWVSACSRSCAFRQATTRSMSICRWVGASSGVASSSCWRIVKAALEVVPGRRDRSDERCGRVVAELGLGEPELLVRVADGVVGLDEDAVGELIEILGRQRDEVGIGSARRLAAGHAARGPAPAAERNHQPKAMTTRAAIASVISVPVGRTAGRAVRGDRAGRGDRARDRGLGAAAAWPPFIAASRPVSVAVIAPT